MCIANDDDDTYFNGVIDDMCNPLEHEMHEKGTSDYINNLISITSTKLTQPLAIKTAYETNGEIGLFKLLYSQSLQNSMLEWSNNVNARTTHFEMSAKEFSIFAGLELAMSLHKCDNIKDYWSTKLFVGDSSFSEYQSRNQHLETRRNIQLHPIFNDATQNTNDPLWHSKHILNHERARLNAQWHGHFSHCNF